VNVQRVHFLYWQSSASGDRLTPTEVEELFVCTQQLMALGQLSNGKYVGATRALYWVRLPKEN